VGLVMVLAANAVSQAALTLGERRKREQVDASRTRLVVRPESGPVKTSGTGPMAVDGPARGPIRTRVRDGRVSSAVPDGQEGVTASGLGAVGIGGDAGWFGRGVLMFLSPGLLPLVLRP
jgi:hypothetical protein